VLLNVRFIDGSFSLFDDEFHNSKKDDEKWIMNGNKGSIEIYLEKYEGYYFSKIKCQSNILFQVNELIKEIVKK